MQSITRRVLLSNGTAAAMAIATPALASAAETRPATEKPLRILVAGAHPGDPEAGCGGTIARYTQLGHAVTALYLTRGEGGVPGRTAAQAAEIRSAEAMAACAILKATAVFAGQIDAATEINAVRSGEFTKLIDAQEPDVVFTQWPLDTHPDHRVCASLTIGAWVALKRRFALYYYDVDLGGDTQCFHPTSFVDVTDVEPLKRQACMAHKSQGAAGADGFYFRDHVPMMRFRGNECGRKNAEAFVHHDASPVGWLPPNNASGR
ncbi:MAG TPA: PIG-L family deacetylase [Tepidisphaeraceae bacterium]|jgi:LmbE family N-acetylglucosaminyl deacetylase|nr:PIG-L family deacetylase [Tepidisphaeraceae bacterium]